MSGAPDQETYDEAIAWLKYYDRDDVELNENNEDHFRWCVRISEEGPPVSPEQVA